MNTAQTAYRPVRRPSDCWPKFLLDEFRRIARFPGSPIVMEAKTDDPEQFRCKPAVASWFFASCQRGQDYVGFAASIAWLKQGPKIADVTEEQYQALAQVEVRLGVSDFQMPYPTILVNMPAGKMHRYTILHRCTSTDGVEILIGASISPDNKHDIVTAVRHVEGKEVEDSIGRFYGEVTEEEGRATHESLRVACNYTLAMTNFGHQAAYLFPAEVAEQRKHVAKGNREYKDGTTASVRLAEQPILIQLDRNVQLYHREGSHEPGEPTGRELCFHWRRGHWRKQRVGKGLQETRIVFVKPCMVRADLLGGTDPTDTTTIYSK